MDREVTKSIYILHEESVFNIWGSRYSDAKHAFCSNKSLFEITFF